MEDDRSHGSHVKDRKLSWKRGTHMEEVLCCEATDVHARGRESVLQLFWRVL